MKLIESVGRGNVPLAAVFEFQRRCKWDQDTAAHALAATFKESWFWGVLGNRLSFKSLTDEEAVKALATEVNALPAYRPQLELVIEFLIASGLIVRDPAGTLKRAPSIEGPASKNNSDAAPHQDVSSQLLPPPPVVNHNSMSIVMNITIPMEKITALGTPEAVKSFYEQWANLVNAKAAIEKTISS